MYKTSWKEEAIEDLKNIDRVMAQKIFSKVEDYLVNNPTEYGKPLVGNLKGLWSFRFSNYRVIYQVKPEELTILIIEVIHRKNAYLKLSVIKNYRIKISKELAKRKEPWLAKQ